MVAVYPERQSRAARWSRRSAIFAVILFAVAGATHRYGRIDSETFLMTLGVVAVLIVLSLCAFCLAFHRMWTRGDKVGTNLVVAGFFLTGALIPFGFLAYRGLTTPMLHDITTDTESRPLLSPVADPTRVMNIPRAMSEHEAEEQLAAYPTVIGHSYTLPPERIRQLITTLVEDRGWQIVRPFPKLSGPAATLNAVAGSFLLGFPCDVAIRVADEETMAYVDMRSASRYGTHDFGDNAARIESFFDDLDAAVLAEAAMPQVSQ
ncbi:DUF1499 domain-containing protein [Tianweitania sp. BSSL-BM11]|uniref:DUF1499 domain-containing protein n=1 Tax=Tianweitania aestuarii TaxID=2814886 RepID=A0ABS5RRX2_9HYPH|nr:DUF1499 domain-containing protein [Tianweitania aestuarii]MBS9719811.1 DUF1499 domain-containing protein [Tianweitania aestuarii]